MKNKIPLTNYILIGVAAILYLLYNNFISVAAMAASFISGEFNETNTAIEIAKIILYNGLFVIIIYSIFTIVNYILSKKEKTKLLIALFIILVIALIVLIIKNLNIFI